MPAASLASLADSKVSNFKKFSKSRNSKKHKIPKKAENNEILKSLFYRSFP